MSIKHTPKSVKDRIQSGYLALLPGWPSPESWLSEFQQARFRRACMVADMYFRKGMTVEKIGALVGGVTHQQISLVLKNAIDILTRRGHLYVPEGKSVEKLNKRNRTRARSEERPSGYT